MRRQRPINTDPKDMEYDFGIRFPAVRYVLFERVFFGNQ